MPDFVTAGSSVETVLASAASPLRIGSSRQSMNAASSVGTPRWRAISSGAPTARTRPACMSEMRSQRSASFMKWVEMKIVTPSSRENRSGSARIVAREPGPRRTSARRGSTPPARGCTATASCSRWRMPSGRPSGATVGNVSRSKPLKHLLHRGCRIRRARWYRARMEVEVLAGRSVRRKARRTATCTRPAGASPCRRRRAAGRRATRCPRVAGSSPVSIFIVVVLPQPLEPRKPKISPRAMRKLTWSTAVKSPKRQVSSSRLDRRRAAARFAAGGIDRRRARARLLLGQAAR